MGLWDAPVTVAGRRSLGKYRRVEPFSITLKALTGWDVFEGLHIVGGIGLLILAAIHVVLNWGWVRVDFLRTAGKKKA